MSTTAVNNPIPEIYDDLGLPTYWRDVKGVGLSAARFRYVERLALDAEDLATLAQYCSYHAGAPAWLKTGPLMVRIQTIVLSDAALRILTRDELEAWLQAAWVAKLDPLETRPL
jgi:hypothetical protein